MNDPPALRPRRLIGATAIALAIPAFAGLAAPRPAAAQCIISATYLGVPYLDAGALTPADAGGRAGRGAIPDCNDVVVFPPGPQPPAPPTPVTLRRVRGVAPRFAVALPSAGLRLLTPATSRCRSRASVEDALTCLRARTRRHVAGPSLVAPPSAQPGAVIPLTVHVQDPARQRQATYGLDALLQQKDADGTWRSLFHLISAIGSGDPPAPVAVGAPGLAIPAIGVIGGKPHTVRLPLVAPGAYRLAKRATLGSRSHWLFSDLTIPAP